MNECPEVWIPLDTGGHLVFRDEGKWIFVQRAEMGTGSTPEFTKVGRFEKRLMEFLIPLIP